MTKSADFMVTEASACRSALRQTLFAQKEYDHERWRRLVASDAFRYRHGLDNAQRTDLTYQRLRVVHGATKSADELSKNLHLLTGMLEWMVTVDCALTTVASIHYNLFSGSLLDHDTDERRDLSDFAELRRIGTFLCTELGHGNDAAALETTATLDPATNEFVLHTPVARARKYMPNTGRPGGPKSGLVAARLLVDGQDLGVFLFLVPLSDHAGFRPGVHVSRLPDRLGSPLDHCLTAFDQVRVPRHALLQGEQGRLAADGTFTSSVDRPRYRFLRTIRRVTEGKLCITAAVVGGNRAVVGIAVRYAHNRHITGPRPGTELSIAELRSHHAPLLDALAGTYAMTILHRFVLRQWVANRQVDPVGAERLIVLAKGWITWQARTINATCRERCGAQGLFLINRIAELGGDLEGGITAEGDNLPIWVKLATDLIAGHDLVDADAPTVAPTGRELTDLAFLRDLLAHSVRIWRVRVVAAVLAAPSRDPLGTLNAAMSPALAAVAASARWLAGVQFLAAVQNTDPAGRPLLGQLCRLFLLGQLSGCMGDLLAEGRVTVEHVRRLPATIDALAEDLAPHMTTLADAFDLPAELLADIPIANVDYLAYLDHDAGSAR